MDEYKEKVANVSVARGIFNDASASATMVGTPQEAVDRMMEQLADSQGISLQQNLEEATPVTTAPAKGVLTEEQENEASERFKALRNAA
jgi:charged multivesicular body protein 1